MKTITYNSAKYKLVPVDPTKNMLSSFGVYVPRAYYEKLIAAVPTDLPGVVEHSGEPIGLVGFSRGEPVHFGFDRNDMYAFPDSRIAPIYDHPPARPATAALSDQDAFETWSKREGWCNLAPAINGTCEDGRFPVTYHYALTETAWRAWANKPNADTTALQARIVEDTFRGDNTKLCSCIDALLELDAAKALVPHGVGGHGRTMLSAAASRIKNLEAQLAAQVGQEPRSLELVGYMSPVSASFMGRRQREERSFGSNAMAHRVPVYAETTLLAEQMRSEFAEKLNVAPPAPANTLAIVQAALEAACESVWDTEHDDRKKVIDDIRAIDPQTIIDAARDK